MEHKERANVEGSYLHQVSGPTLRLDSTAWIAWLEEASTTSFRYGLHDHERGYIVGWITVRKEQRKRGGSYWVAYRRQGRQLHKRYLGKSEMLTAASLATMAQTLWMSTSPPTP